MVEPLQILLEKEFKLCYHVPGFSITDLRNMDIRKRDWFYHRLAKQFHDEDEAIKGKNV